MVESKPLAKQKNLWDEPEETRDTQDESEESEDEESSEGCGWEKDYADYCAEQDALGLVHQEDEYLHWLYGDHIRS